jgi:hypothetical protein
VAPVTSPNVYLVNGWNGQIPTGFPANLRVTNEMWKAPKNNLLPPWTLVHAHDATPPTTGPNRWWWPGHTTGIILHTINGQEYIYNLGGDSYGSAATRAMVWRLPVYPDGTEGLPELMTDTFPGVDIQLHMSASYLGALHRFGGQSNLDYPTTAVQTHYHSMDGGVTWPQLPDFPFPARGMVYDPCIYKGKLTVFGGGTFATDISLRTNYNDAYAWDGATWTQLIADGVAPVPRRQYHSTRVFQDMFCIINGFDLVQYAIDNIGNLGDMWTTTDFASFTPRTIPPWRPSHADGTCVSGDKLLVGWGNGDIGEGFPVAAPGPGKLWSVRRLGVAS